MKGRTESYAFDVDSFFGTPWPDLTLDHVEAFLSDAGDEGLTWEAKGTERPRRESVRKNVSAFANAEGGFYIVGASRVDGGWQLDPIDFGADEAGTWLAQVIRSNVLPIPWFDVKSFECEGGSVVVVNVAPVSEPPCMTTNGEVYTRVSGESYPVRDPGTLRRLFERGEGRAAQTEVEALRAAAVPENEGDLDAENPYLRLRLAFAPTGRLDDVGGRLFTRPYYDALAAAMYRLPRSPLFEYPAFDHFAYGTTQDSVFVRERHPDNRQRWTVQARWDGSVAVYLDVLPNLAEDRPRLLDVSIFGAAVRPGSQLLTDLVRELGGYGRAHVALVVHARRFEVESINGNAGQIPAPNTMRPIQAWTDADVILSDAKLDRMRRELCRAAGAVVWEPEPEGDAPEA